MSALLQVSFRGDMDKLSVFKISGSGRSRSLRDLSIPRELRIFMLAPHPDDFDAIGVTLRHFRQGGAQLQVAVVPTCSGVEDSFCRPPTPENKQRTRIEEQKASCRFFGLPDDALKFVALPKDNDDQPRDCPEGLEIVSAILNGSRPDIVFLPHGNDTNTGHQNICSMFKKWASKAGYPLGAFLIKDPKTIEMRVDFHMPFGEGQATWKGELLRCHKSQQSRNLNTRGHGFDDRILRVNRGIAQELGIPEKYAEAFEAEMFQIS